MSRRAVASVEGLPPGRLPCHSLSRPSLCQELQRKLHVLKSAAHATRLTPRRAAAEGAPAAAAATAMAPTPTLGSVQAPRSARGTAATGDGGAGGGAAPESAPASPPPPPPPATAAAPRTPGATSTPRRPLGPRNSLSPPRRAEEAAANKPPPTSDTKPPLTAPARVASARAAYAARGGPKPVAARNLQKPLWQA